MDQKPLLVAYLEDDPDQAHAVEIWLEDAGHRVEVFATGETFMKHFRDQPFDSALLDWELPDTDGLHVLGWLRKNVGRELPVIFLTKRDSEDDVVQALRNGADDYLVKPLSPRITLARLNAVMRRSGSDPQFVRGTIGPYQYDKRLERISRDGEPVALTRKEFLLAMVLLENLGRVVTRDSVLTEVWGLNQQVMTRTVDTHISRLRKKLGWVPERGWSLKSIYHQGYRLEQLDRTAQEDTP